MVPKGYHSDSSPALSPDGRTLAFIRNRDTYSRAVILKELNPDGTTRDQEREATAYDSTMQELAWQPDGRGLILSVRLGGERAGLFRLIMGRALQPLGIDNGIVRWPSLSQTGKRLVYERRYMTPIFIVWTVPAPTAARGPTVSAG